MDWREPDGCQQSSRNLSTHTTQYGAEDRMEIGPGSKEGRRQTRPSPVSLQVHVIKIQKFKRILFIGTKAAYQATSWAQSSPPGGSDAAYFPDLSGPVHGLGFPDSVQ